MTKHLTQDLGVARQISNYSDGVEVQANMRWLFSSGTPGLAVDGTVPDDIAGQTELAWQHILRSLEKAGMTVADLVKVTQYLTRPEDIAVYTKIRKRILGDASPAFMLSVVSQLVRPEFLVEVEVIAASPANKES